MVTVKVEGFKYLDQALKELPEATRKPTLRRALKKAAVPMAELANQNAPVGPTGDYAKSFAYSTRLNKRQGKLHRKLFKDDRAAVEGFVGTDDPAGVQQEFGNQNHGPQPALRPAWDADKDQLVNRLGKELGPEIERTAKRAAARARRNGGG